MALCAAALVVETYALLRLPVNPRVTGLAACATLLSYAAHAALRAPRHTVPLPGSRLAWISRHRAVLRALSVAALAGGLLLFDFRQPRLLALCLPLALLTLGYTLPLVKRQGRWQPLRNLPLLKVFLIALVWAAVTVLLPYWSEALLPAGFPWLLFLRRFLFVLALALLFDIRDLPSDARAGVLTLPVALGISKARLVSYGALGLFCALAPVQLPLCLWLPLFVSGLAAAGVTAAAQPGRSDYFYSLLADGMLLLQGLLVAAAGAWLCS